MTPARFPHSDTPGSQLGCQLPRAYRRLQRPSSALDAKASTMCPQLLAKQTLNKHKTQRDTHYILHNPTPLSRRHPRRNPSKRCGLMLASTINMTNTKKPISHGHPSGHPGPDVSGPNSVSFTPPLRTPPPFHTHQPLPPEGRNSYCVVLGVSAPHRRTFIDDSTSEHHQCPTNGRRGRGVCAP